MKIIDAADFIAQDLPEPKQVIRGILHQGSKLVLGGGSKAYKTWVLLDMALSISHGAEWLSFKTTPGRVLYVNFELQPFELQKRIKLIAEAKGIQIEQGMLDVLNLRGQANDYKIILPQIQSACRDRGYALVILDPTYKLYGGADENSASSIAELLNSFEKFTVATGAAIAFAAHFSKGNQSGKASIDRISGSGVFARDPDSLIILTEHTDDNAYIVEATLRSFAPVSSFVIQWDHPLMKRTELDPSNVKRKNGGRDKKYSIKELLLPIIDTTAENPISMTKWAALAGKMKRQTLAGYTDEMRNEGFIATAGKGTTARQYITEKGRLLAQGVIK